MFLVSAYSGNLPKQRLWLHIFHYPRICSLSFHYKKCFHNDSFETRKLQKTLKGDFTCRFPFFWLIKNAVDSSWGKVLGKCLEYSKFTQESDLDKFYK